MLTAKTFRKDIIMTITALRIALAIAISAVSTAGCTAPDKASSNGNSSAWNLPSSVAETPTAVPPAPADFLVDVIVTEQKCFGSAGCIYHYTINPQYLSATPLPDKTTVVFTVTGGDQDQIGNFTIDSDGTATFDRETNIDGPEGADLRATVTKVIPGR